MSALLELNDLVVNYGGIQALCGITLSVQQGRIVTLIGANGAGKSSTLRAISGLVRPRSGTIRWKGEEIQDQPVEAIPGMGIGHVPEGRRIFPQLTVEENLDMGAYLVRDRKAIAQRKREVYELFPRLGDRRRQDGGTLSGGEQQMLAMGRALMQDPELLLLDEPTLGLAPILVDTVFETIQHLHAAGKTILLVEQNAWQALQIAQYAYVLQSGNIVREGDAQTLANDPAVQEIYLGG